jgi:hypothetical protein
MKSGTRSVNVHEISSAPMPMSFAWTRSRVKPGIVIAEHDKDGVVEEAAPGKGGLESSSAWSKNRIVWR